MGGHARRWRRDAVRAFGPDVGNRFGPYELRYRLGHGGVAEVFEAFDTVRGRMVALELLAEEFAQDPEFQVRFRQELQIAARLRDAHLVDIHDWGVIDGRLFVDRSLIAGSDIGSIVRASGPLAPDRAVTVLEHLASGLDVAHAAGLVHRDIKPGAILLTEADQAYLTGFGLAHEGDSAVTMVGTAVSSFGYKAPEWFDMAPVDILSDIYSLTAVLYFCLTGLAPYPTGTMTALISAHRHDPPPRPSLRTSGVPTGLDGVVARGMAKDPAARYHSAGELAQAARAALRSPRTLQGRGGSGRTPGTSDSGGMATLVLRLPEPAAAAGNNLPPGEGTGDLPAVIPGDPTRNDPSQTLVSTEVDPIAGDVASGSLPVCQGPESEPFEGSGPRPFPDAHLYSENQLHPAVDPHARRSPVPTPAPAVTHSGAIPRLGDLVGVRASGLVGEETADPPTRALAVARPTPARAEPAEASRPTKPTTGIATTSTGYPVAHISARAETHRKATSETPAWRSLLPVLAMIVLLVTVAIAVAAWQLLGAG